MPSPPNSIKFITDSCPPFKYDEDHWHKMNGDRPVIIRYSLPNHSFPEHWTPLSIRCAFGGKVFYNLSHTKYAVSDRNFLLLNEGCMYSGSTSSHTTTESFTITFPPALVERMIASLAQRGSSLLDSSEHPASSGVRFIQKSYSYNDALTPHIARIRAMTPRGKQNEALIEEELYFLFEGLVLMKRMTDMEINSMSARRKTTREELYKRLHVAKDFIDSCYAEDLSLADLSRASSLNQFHLLREFKKTFRITPHQYLIRRRLEEAKQILITTDEPVARVGDLVGLSEASSFSKLFKRHFSLSPEHYRKSNCVAQDTRAR